MTSGFPAPVSRQRSSLPGTGYPRKTRQIALTSLEFARSAGNECALRRFPDAGSTRRRAPVLLSECCNDMRLAASEGPGFDPGVGEEDGWLPPGTSATSVHMVHRRPLMEPRYPPFAVWRRRESEPFEDGARTVQLVRR